MGRIRLDESGVTILGSCSEVNINGEKNLEKESSEHAVGGIVIGGIALLALGFCMGFGWTRPKQISTRYDVSQSDKHGTILLDRETGQCWREGRKDVFGSPQLPVWIPIHGGPDLYPSLDDFNSQITTLNEIGMAATQPAEPFELDQ